MMRSKVNASRLWSKLKGSFTLIGQAAVTHALILFYTLRAPETPAWCKSVVLGSLGYFISLVDGIPDLTPFLGYTDDIALMAATIATISSHITPQIKERAEQEAQAFFKNHPPSNSHQD